MEETRPTSAVAGSDPKVVAANKRRLFTATQILIVFTITCALWLGMDFSRRAGQGQRIQMEAERVAQEVAREQGRNTALSTQLTYVQGDAYVEDWARSDMKMVRPGERLVVPVINAPPAVPAGTGAGTPSAPTPWAVWWTVLFGDVRVLAQPVR